MSKWKFPAITSDVLAFLAILTAAAIIGVIINSVRPDPLGLVYKSRAERLANVVDELSGPSRGLKVERKIAFTTIDQLKALLKSGGVGVVDARPEIFYKFGHIPGAISLPRDNFRASFDGVEKQLNEQRSGQIVVYCSGEICEDSKLVAIALMDLGFENVSVYEGGWDEWSSVESLTNE